MGKGRQRGGKTDKEYDEIQKLKSENKRLKLQVSKLRKVAANIDRHHYTFVQDLLDSEDMQEDTKAAEVQIQRKMEDKWGCHLCGKGVMRLVILHRAGEPYYIRKCDHCDNKTKLKKYTDDIEGV